MLTERIYEVIQEKSSFETLKLYYLCIINIFNLIDINKSKIDKVESNIRNIM
jgi:hypothetical protein